MKIDKLEIGKIYKSSMLKYQLMLNKSHLQLFYFHPLFNSWCGCKLKYNEVIMMDFQEI